jgi:hypothetical protein
MTIGPVKKVLDKVVETGESLLSGLSPYDVKDDTLGQNKYNFTSMLFPSDIGNDHVGHYMVININVPTDRDREVRGAFADQFEALTPIEHSKVDILRFGQGLNLPPGAQQREAFAMRRFTRRIAHSIALYMPSPLVYTSIPRYDDISLTAIGGGILSSTASGILSRVGGGLLGQIIGAAGANIGTVASLAGYPINPRIEIIYATTDQREFVFEFLMAPRNEAESAAVRNIIQTLRFHSAPELDPQTSGLTFIPPAEFDITFFHRGEENRAIPRINTCVLTRIDMDYAPTGIYSTFTNGHPVAVRLSLAFREIEIIHKLRVTQGF